MVLVAGAPDAVRIPNSFAVLPWATSLMEIVPLVVVIVRPLPETPARMIVPVGAPFSAQSLLLVRKDAKGRVTTRQVLPVSFVPLTRAR